MDERTPNTMLNALLVALSERCATPLSRVKETTLDEYEGRLYNRLYKSKLYSWITPHELRPTMLMQRFGMQACPQCLAEDDVPYFRRRWRLAFVIACPRHNYLVIDRCPDCGAPIRFHQSADYAVGGKITLCYKCLFDLRNTKARRTAAPEIVEFQEHLVKVAKKGFVKTKGFDATVSGEYFEGLHWILRISTHWHPVVNEIQKAIFAYYNLESNLFNFPKEQSIESLEVSRRYELVRLLRCLLIDKPNKYLRSSCSHDLMCRVWLNKWRHTSFWRSGVYGLAGKPLIIKRANTQMSYRKRPERLTSSVKYSQLIRLNELKRAALQLFLDGISTLHIASMLNVPRIEVWEWIKERCKSAQPGRKAQGRTRSRR